MGTLTLTPNSTVPKAPQSVSSPLPDPSASTLHPSDPGPMHGRPLETELHIVLENITSGFTKPNILDVKLGARLWDDGVPPAKRARLDGVSEKSTSGSLGMRIAGMKVWRPTGAPGTKVVGKVPAKEKEVGDQAQSEGAEKEMELWQYDQESGYVKYNKLYGRGLTADNVRDGFEEYLCLTDGHTAGAREGTRTEEVLQYFTDEICGIQEMLEHEESRMYSASILFVYEGDIETYEATREKLTQEVEDEAQDGEDDGEGGDDEDEDAKVVPKLAAVKIIDFAHARWTPGQGPDENVLQGVRSTARILKTLLVDVGS
jgi:1D-myo-inositol-tetrakisphosphate 5-kinase/inositol-polyphosphate multikinase